MIPSLLTQMLMNAREEGKGVHHGVGKFVEECTIVLSGPAITSNGR